MDEIKTRRLADEIFFAGFKLSTDEFNKILNSKEAKPTHTDEVKYGKDTTMATLHFRRDKDDLYFNAIEMEVKKEGKQDSIKQLFKMNYGTKITRKKVYNMLEGRFANVDFLPARKKDETTGKVLPPERDEEGKVKTLNAWFYLDFTEKDKEGNFLVKRVFDFDAEKAVALSNFKEKNFPQSKSDFINSLKVGNLQSGTYVHADGTEELKYASANPKFHTLNIYDSKLIPERFTNNIPKEQLQQINNTQSKNQADDNPIDQAAKQNKLVEKQGNMAEDVSDTGKPAKQNRNKRQGIS